MYLTIYLPPTVVCQSIGGVGRGLLLWCLQTRLDPAGWCWAWSSSHGGQSCICPNHQSQCFPLWVRWSWRWPESASIFHSQFVPPRRSSSSQGMCRWCSSERMEDDPHNVSVSHGYGVQEEKTLIYHIELQLWITILVCIYEFRLSTVSKSWLSVLN